MYGMVNDAVRSFALELLGPSGWETIRRRAGAPESFDKMSTYDDKVTGALIQALAEATDQTGDAVLRRFGNYWIEYAAATSYGPMIKIFGSTYAECLRNLNQLHLRMGRALPALRAPEFACAEVASHHLRVTYRSTREGLAPFVHGLLEGLGRFYDTPVTVAPPVPGDSPDQRHFDVIIHAAA